MGVVARDTAHPALAGAEAPARTHLLDLPDKAVACLADPLCEHRQEPVKRQPGPVIFLMTMHAFDALFTDQMTLFANCITKGWLKIRGVDDSRIGAIDDGGCHRVQLARTMTSLAANRMPLEDGRPVLIGRPGNNQGVIGVAVEAAGADCAIEVKVCDLKAW